MKEDGFLESDGNQVKHLRAHGRIRIPRGMNK
jgi:hypothetical protein